MRPHGTASELERRRRLAVARVRSGYTQTEVAQFLGIHRTSVGRWIKAYHEGGRAALAAKKSPGRPPKLTAAREREVLGWFSQSPTKFGFSTELWTAPRVAKLVAKKFHVHFHPRYINQWLSEHRVTPQKPTRQARERDAQEVRRWLREECPRIKKA